jgi:hypothetical protein
MVQGLKIRCTWVSPLGYSPCAVVVVIVVVVHS